MNRSVGLGLSRHIKRHYRSQDRGGESKCHSEFNLGHPPPLLPQSHKTATSRSTRHVKSGNVKDNLQACGEETYRQCFPPLMSGKAFLVLIVLMRCVFPPPSLPAPRLWCPTLGGRGAAESSSFHLIAQLQHDSWNSLQSDAALSVSMSCFCRLLAPPPTPPPSTSITTAAAGFLHPQIIPP